MQRLNWWCTLLIAAAAGTGAPNQGLSPSATPPPGERLWRRPIPKLQGDYGRLPLSFESNRGQFDRRVQFVARGRGYGLALTPAEAVLVLRKQGSYGDAVPRYGGVGVWGSGSGRTPAPPHTHTHTPPHSQTVLHMRLLRANPHACVTPQAPLPGKVNYLLGKDPAKWRTGIPTYGKVRYQSVYPGIDLVYYGNEGQLEYDFVVAPGADPGRIRFAVQGARAIRINRRGDLVLHTAGGDLVQRAPVVYQDPPAGTRGRRHAVAGRYVVGPKSGKVEKWKRPDRILHSSILPFFKSSTQVVRFALGAYDRSRPLVIDPTLVYSTYLSGGSGQGIAVDVSGNAYVAGSTNFAGSQDIFVTKLTPDGSSIVYSTHLGGSSTEWPYALAVDGSGNACVTGETSSADFPVSANAYQPLKGPSNQAFVTKLDATGSALMFSTYHGPSGLRVVGFGIAAGSDRGTYVAGYNSGGQAFVTKFDLGGGLAYSLSLGGNGSSDIAHAIAVDSSGNAYVTGETDSTDFPTRNALYPNHQGGFYDAFVTEVNPSGTALVYSTYLGGNADSQGHGGSDAGLGIAVDPSGNAYVTGETGSPSFPTTPGAFQTAPGASFVTKIAAGGGALAYSTYLGGANTQARGIAADAAGSAYVAGYTFSPDFPLKDSLQPYLKDAYAFVTRFDLAGLPTYSTLLGGVGPAGGRTVGNAIAVDDSDNAYVTGFTLAADFPTVNPLPPTGGGVFISKISPANSLPATHLRLTAPASVTAGAVFSFTVTALSASNTVATGYTGTVHFTSGDPGATLPFDYTFVPADQGGRAFDAILVKAGNQTIIATDAALPIPSVTATLNVLAGPTADLVFGQQPTNTPVGTVIAPPLTVRLLDAFGNLATSAADPLTLALAANPGGGTLGGTTTTNAVSGVATFSNLTIDKPGDGYTLQATAATLPGKAAISNPFNIGARPATHFSVTAPATAQSGVPFSFTVTALDAANGVATGYAGAVHFTSSDPQATLPPNYTFVPADQGVRSFSAPLKKAGAQTLTATDTGNAAITGSATITVNPGEVADLVFGQQPTNTGVGAVIAPPVTVRLLDASGNLATTAANPVTLVLGANPSAATLGGIATVAAANGVATFSTLTVDKAGIGYTLRATTPGLPGKTATSAPFNVTGRPATHFSVTAPATVTAGTPFTLGVTALDATNTVATGYTGTVHFTGNDPLALLPGDYTFLPADSGAHSFTVTLKSAGSRTITVTDRAAPAISGSVTVNVVEAQSLVVTTDADVVSAADGVTSLREAILAANARPGLDTITFKIVAGGKTITPTTPLPTITDPVVIDGYTQPGTHPNTRLPWAGTDAVLLIELNGASAGKGVNGLVLAAGGSTVRGLVVNRFQAALDGGGNIINGAGIRLQGPGGNTITGCFLGTSAAGTPARPNQHGLEIDGSAGNVIGGTTRAAMNLISGNTFGTGVVIKGSAATANLVQGNLIGTDVTGTAAVRNSVGVYLAGGADNTIGGTDAGNVLSGNSSGGVVIGSGSGNRVQGNRIGTRVDGKAALRNVAAGIEIGKDATDNLVGGEVPGAGNVLSGNGTYGLLLNGSGNTVLGNFAGTNAAGTGPLANGIDGIYIGGANNRIGGASPLAGNLLSGNTNSGVAIVTTGTEASGNVVRGNLIGTNFDGTIRIPNLDGVYVSAKGNVIGGTAPGEGNLIADNSHSGVFLGNTGTVVQGNRIVSNLAVKPGGLGVGIYVFGLSNTIGGLQAGARNVIVGNGEGVLLFGLFNVVQGNVVSGNVGNGIEITFGFSSDNIVQGNFIGTDATGMLAQPNGTSGVEISGGAVRNLIGGDSAAARNVISGNKIYGVFIRDAGSRGNRVQGNYIGTNAAGNAAVANVFGVVTNSPNTTVGGTAPGAGNLISGNVGSGVALDGGANGSVVEHNLIGTNAAGTGAIPNLGYGVLLFLDTSDTTIGGTAPGAGNLISGNTNDGIFFNASVGGHGTGNRVQGNLIGTDFNGTLAVPNGGSGIHIRDGYQNNLIGGTSPAARNVISGNKNSGVYIQDAGSVGNNIQGNYIGTNVTGEAAVPNQGDAVSIASPDNLVGGSTPGAGNLISGNGAGVTIGAPATRTRVQGNRIGTNAGGSRAVPNQLWGVAIFGAANNLVGGTAPGEGNLISGNGHDAVGLLGDANLVQGNVLGLNVAGNAAIPNFWGVFIHGGRNNLVGGTAPGAGNVISGNTGAGLLDGLTSHGVLIAGVSGNTVQGNFIGTNAAGTAAFPNSTGVGIQSGATNNLIGGTTAAARNVISGNGAGGVTISGLGTTGNRVQGNYVGTNAAGDGPLPNGQSGIVLSTASSNIIGGTGPGARNVISGNQGSGVYITAGANFNSVQGNRIGTNAAGMTAVPNLYGGVRVVAANNFIGGAGQGQGNLVSGNFEFGVGIGNASGTVVFGNAIGLDASGAAPLPNLKYGILIGGGMNSTVGGILPGQANRIAFNAGDGVAVASGSSATRNAISGNAIFRNGRLGIDLVAPGDPPNGVTPNAPGLRAGPNHLQNYPVLTSATAAGGQVIVTGTLNSTPSATFVLDFYRSVAPNASGFGEGEVYLGNGTISTGKTGNASFSLSLPVPGNVAGQWFTATASRRYPTGEEETSEFSQALQAP